ncbi:MAG: adenosylmethionine--8-amino-7-oxononanoate transaminase [Rhodospirillaceae bacterium]|nr:adenosylmethionine--8-amino-7-oxononanoate transaminase [Rhodospirillaceae bacterium]MDD9914344.1 adenosylmethionine--8-amino-7-oxononanoate transaminase [Rhodospirillaceae bacterium]MDD9924392.1 adenosylmethionine--8-amino-7-oxononanoate transaminase [Rhodospirillaceae bacterium]
MQTTPPPVPVAATDGVFITLSDGRRLVDGVSSWWTACHGYNHPHIREAVTEQLGRMPHVMFGGLAHEPALTLAQRLSALLPGDLSRVFFSESGSVSVEIAMKMALQFWINNGETQRRKFIGFEYAYHGDTIGAMSVCDPEEGMHALFSGLLPEQHIVPLPRTDDEFVRFETFLSEHAAGCAAVIIEPLVQGAGGMKMHSPETLARLHQTAKRHDLLVIVDEIMTGFGRTGSLFASEQAGIAPDIVTLSKALTGGTMALAATVATNAIFDAFLSDDPEAALMHGPTYMANPLACAAAHASLDLFEREPRLDQVSSIEKHLREALEPCRDMAGVVDVRVKGAIGTVQLQDFSDHDAFKAAFVEKGVWIRPFGDIVYVMPPFIIEERELACLTGAMCEVVGDWSARRSES